MYSVQQLIVQVKNGAQLGVLFEELETNLDRLICNWFYLNIIYILVNQRSGVVCKLIETSASLGALQKEILKGVCEAFGATTLDDKKRMVEMLLHLTKLEYLESKGPINLQYLFILMLF